jgi:hypothetical protein
MSRRLVLYPNGKKNSNGNGHISLYLAIANTKDLQLGWEVNANIKFFVFDQIRDKYLCIQGTFAQNLVFIVDLSLICFVICPSGNISLIYLETCYSLNSYSSLIQLILNLGLIDLMVASKKNIDRVRWEMNKKRKNNISHVFISGFDMYFTIACESQQLRCKCESKTLS